MQIVQQEFVATLIALMPVHGIRKHFRTQTRGCQHAVGHDKSVHQNHHAQLGRTQHAAYGHHHLIPSETAQDFFHRMLSREMLEGLLKYLEFMGHGFAIQAAAGTDTLFQRDSRQAAHPQRGSGSVSHSHLAKTDHIATCFLYPVHTLRTSLQTQIHLFGSHRIAIQKIAGTSAYLHIHNPFFIRQVIIHSGIDNHQSETVLATQEIDTCPSVKEITDLLPGNFFRRCTDAFFHNAMIGCKK